MTASDTQFSDGQDCGQLQIDLHALADNYHHISTQTKAETAAVVKADAYGLGMQQVVAALLAAKCQTFFVAQLSEGVALRALAPNAVIYVLNGLATHTPQQFCTHRLVPCLNTLEQMARWQAHCQATKNNPAALMLDIGFNRLGLGEPALAELATQKDLFAGWQLQLIIGHLACADDAKHPMNRAQLEAFRNALAILPPAPASLANSGGVLLGQDYHFDMVRVGIALYGGIDHKNLKPVAHLRAPILQIRTLAQGETIGYAADFTAAHDMTIGIIGLGYGDGVLRQLAMRPIPSHIWVGASPAPLVGRISMDTLAIDLTNHNPTPNIGDMVELFGAHNHIATLAQSGNTNAYELLTRLGSRHKRRYV